MQILIVDDEPVIRTGLKQLIDWNHYGYTLIGDAADGKAALELLRDQPVDIIITDIRMPVMDGLELIRALRERDYDAQVIILSCLDDFQYVKEAMRLGVHDYILKPTMEPEELIDIVEASRKQLEEKRQQRKQTVQWKKEIERFRPFQLAADIRKYLEYSTVTEGLENQLLIPEQTLHTLYVHTAPNLNIGRFELPDVLASLRWFDQGLLIFIHCEQSINRVNSVRQAVTRRLQEIRSALHLTSDQNNWFIGVGPEIRCLTDIAGNVEIHYNQIRQFHYMQTFTPILWEAPSAAHNSEDTLPEEARNDLLRAVYNQNQEGILHQVQDLVRQMKESRPHPRLLYPFLFEMIGLTVGFAKEHGFHDIDSFEQRYYDLQELQSCLTHHALSRQLVGMYRDLLERKRGNTAPEKNSHPFIRKALVYMRKHYQEPIGTVDIAEFVKLSRSYFSDMYSKEMGESLIQTLTRIRIEESKKRLVTNQYKVYEIAAQVGFNDAKSFTKAFKKMVGISPKEYAQENK